MSSSPLFAPQDAISALLWWESEKEAVASYFNDKIPNGIQHQAKVFNIQVEDIVSYLAIIWKTRSISVSSTLNLKIVSYLFEAY